MIKYIVACVGKFTNLKKKHKIRKVVFIVGQTANGKSQWGINIELSCSSTKMGFNLTIRELYVLAVRLKREKII